MIIELEIGCRINLTMDSELPRKEVNSGMWRCEPMDSLVADAGIVSYYLSDEKMYICVYVCIIVNIVSS